MQIEIRVQRRTHPQPADFSRHLEEFESQARTNLLIIMLNLPIKRNVQLSMPCNRHINSAKSLFSKKKNQEFSTSAAVQSKANAKSVKSLQRNMLNWNQLLSSLGLLLYNFLFRETEK